MSEVRYRVVAYRTRTLCRVFKVEELIHKPMYFGNWKRLITAKRMRRELNKDRCETVDRDGTVTDHGRSFRNVRIEEASK